MTRTKLIFTLGPATDRPSVLAALIRAGMNCARINFAHGTHADHTRRIQALRAEARRQGATVATLVDLAGPKLRVGRFPGGEVRLAEHSRVRLTPRAVLGSQELIPVSYAGLARDVRPGERILLDDGLLELAVERSQGADVLCRVKTGGKLRDHKGLNLPGTQLKVPALTAKDRRDLALALRLGLDYVALSFVTRPGDLRLLRGLIRRAGGHAGIVAKIEKPQALACLEEVILAADGVMVARGDLGVELSPERVPGVQKRIIAQANRLGRFVITATQMLQSMITQPTPTRAEASDVANAIFDGSDALLLSGETAAGQYPVQAARMLAAIAREAESQPGYNRLHPEQTGTEDRVVSAAAGLAESLRARALVVFTHSGRTACLVSRLRPQVPVIALAHSAEVQRRLQLYWGLDGLSLRRRPGMENVVREAEVLLLRSRRVRQGDVMVIVAGSPAGRAANFLKVQAVGQSG
ncbi:MAG: pyruvate kinase [candidate division FCPU426 bacterium]